MAAVLTASMTVFSGQIAQAEDKPELVIYTHDSFASDWGPGPQIKAEFEKHVIVS